MENDAVKEQKTIMQFYGALVASLLCNFVPIAVVQGFGFCLFLVVLIAAYIYKARASLDSLLYNHMTYLIGTIWVGSTLIVIGMGIASYWVYSEGDHTLIQQMMNNLNNGVMMSEAQMHDLFMNYIHQNKMLLIKATACTIGPGMLYFIYRISLALNRASNGYRLAKPASWI